jgi:hypothetical protein
MIFDWMQGANDCVRPWRMQIWVPQAECGTLVSVVSLNGEQLEWKADLRGGPGWLRQSECMGSTSSKREENRG